MSELESDLRPLPIENEIPIPSPKDETDALGDKSYLNFKLKHILCCNICQEIRRSPIFQCKLGHLLCAGCICDIFAESKMQNEIPACPNCQSALKKESFFRNIAVEKTISELPRTCHYCSLQISPDNFLHHQKILCEKRPSICCNNSIGCSWKGPFSQKLDHEEDCKQLSANGSDILQSLLTMDEEVKKEVAFNEQIYELLSVETFLHFDLQFKRCPVNTPDDEIEESFDTPRFSAYDNQWMIHGYFKKNLPEFNFQLQVKSTMARTKTLNLYFLLVKGPYSDMDLKPKLCNFKFHEKATESPVDTLTLFHNTESMKSCFSGIRINFRLFFFLAK